MPDPASPVYIDDLITPYFEEVGGRFASTFCRGQIYWAHTYYPHENLQVWRPRVADPATGVASDFNPASSAPDLFTRSVPLFNPRLKTNEEFLLLRCKVRPVVLLADLPPDTGIRNLRGGGVIDRSYTACLPFYSIDQKETGNSKFPEEFVKRLRLCEYPQFLFTPAHPRLQNRRSFIRLDSLQPVFRSHLKALDLRLSGEALKLLDSQCEAHFSKRNDGVFTSYRTELLLQASPTRT